MPGNILVWLVILISLAPVFYINRIIQKKIEPRKSGKRLLIYMLVTFALVFAYTFLIVWAISHLIPHSIK
jgi:hypothetical protein